MKGMRLALMGLMSLVCSAALAQSGEPNLTCVAWLSEPGKPVQRKVLETYTEDPSFLSAELANVSYLVDIFFLSSAGLSMQIYNLDTSEAASQFSGFYTIPYSTQESMGVNYYYHTAAGVRVAAQLSCSRAASRPGPEIWLSANQSQRFLRKNQNREAAMAAIIAKLRK